VRLRRTQAVHKTKTLGAKALAARLVVVHAHLGQRPHKGLVEKRPLGQRPLKGLVEKRLLGQCCLPCLPRALEIPPWGVKNLCCSDAACPVGLLHASRQHDQWLPGCSLPSSTCCSCWCGSRYHCCPPRYCYAPMGNPAPSWYCCCSACTSKALICTVTFLRSTRELRYLSRLCKIATELKMLQGQAMELLPCEQHVH